MHVKLDHLQPEIYTLRKRVNLFSMTPGIKRRAAHPDAKEQVCLRCMRTHVIVTISLGISNLLKCPAIEITKAPGKKL